jgi:acetyltransferase-like isoleucine patch superfamily enzyme
MIKLRKISHIFKYLFGLPKSIYVNFRLLPFHQAIKLPIIVSNKTKIISLGGRVDLGRVKTGIIRIGFGGTEHIDYSYARTILKIDGIANFKGRAKIGLGSKFLIDKEAIFSAGERFGITGDTTILCSKKITIGDNTTISWQSIIMDSDHHPVFDTNNNIINTPTEIIIGNNVWIGARCFILKNTYIDDGCIIAANTTVTKNFNGVTHSVIGGVSAKVLKTDIRWYN